MKIRLFSEKGIYTNDDVVAISVAEGANGALDVRELDGRRHIWMHLPDAKEIEINHRILVDDVIKLTTYDIQIKKYNEKGQLVEADLDDWRFQEVKRIRPSSDGGRYMLTIEI